MKAETIKRIDASHFDFNGITFDSLSEVELTINLGDLSLRNRTDETFNDLITRAPYREGNLFFLTRIRLLLHSGGILNLVNMYKGIIDNSYLNRLEILLNKAGFINPEVIETSIPVKIKALRRPEEVVDVGYGLTLREVIYPEEIRRCHLYAKDYYYYKDFNYDLAVVKQFDLNCDHFAVFDENNEIYSFARIVLRVPGYYCPFMYATIAGTEENRHVSLGDNDTRAGEVMAIYSAGKQGVVAFKKMMEYLTQYGSDIAHFDSVWTTYDTEDAYTGTYYKNKFFMEETGIKLQYSDFGGEWNLLVTRKISELKNLHSHLFNQHRERIDGNK